MRRVALALITIPLLAVTATSARAGAQDARTAVRVGLETHVPCPTLGEIQAALGEPFFLAPMQPNTTPEIALRLVPGEGGGLQVRANNTERMLPDADCATLARLVAIIVRGVEYSRSGVPTAPETPVETPTAPAPPPPSPVVIVERPEPSPTGTRAFVRLGLSLGPGLEIDPFNGAFVGQLDAGFGFGAFVMRLAVAASTITTVGPPSDPVDRTPFVARLDVGGAAWLGADTSLGARLGLGTVISRVVSETLEPNEFTRVTPIVGLQVFVTQRLVGPLGIHAEVAADVPLIRDAYDVVGEGVVAQAPVALGRLLVGAHVDLE